MVAVAGLGAAVGNQLHTERGLEEVRRLSGVADDEDECVPAGHREPVLALVVLHQPDQRFELVEIEVGPALIGREGDRMAHNRTLGQRGRAVQAWPVDWSGCTDCPGWRLSLYTICP